MTLPEMRLSLLRRAKQPGWLGAFLARAALRIVPRGSGDLEFPIWGRRLRLPGNHHLPFILGTNPFWAMPLVHCAAALSNPTLTVVDVGANVGDSVALLERYLPGRSKYICIEPNSEWIPYLEANTAGLPVEIIRRFVGEGQRLAVRPGDPGTAGSKIAESGDPSVPLDEILAGRQIDLIKVDTDGFDFPILRSGVRTLSSTLPALFFEWDPALWSAQGEKPEAVFDWLADAGYTDFCFFSDDGFLHCRTRHRQAETIQSLVAASASRRNIDNVYWDVLAASADVCDRAIENNLKAARRLSAEVQPWNRLQPAYWQ
jgi:FkbM family methyltransferase